MNVSVVIPAYNVEEYIIRSVNSVINQIQVQEVIVVDDGSSDNTIKVCNEVFGSHPKFKLLFHPNGENRGACASRNLGLKTAKSDWVHFLDSDDYMSSNSFDITQSYFNDCVDLVMSSFYVKKKDSWRFVEVSSNDYFLSFIGFRFGCTNSNTWRKSFLINVGAWNIDWPSNQDYELYLRALKSNVRIAVCSKPISHYLKRENSISTNGNNQGWQRQIQLRLDLGDFLFENHMMSKKRSDALHKFLYNKLILLRRNPRRINEWRELNQRFIKSKWFKTSSLFRVNRKAVLYKLLGFNVAELIIRQVRC